jgi:SAM-dependent methyltransferase
MVRAVAETFTFPGPILEIGALQVDEQQDLINLRTLFPGRAYIGSDIRPGPGVDVLADVERLPFADRSVGSVLALSTLEHVPRFWKGFEEIQRVLRPDGVLLLAMPFYFHIHDYPHDYWRFTPDALRFLLDDYPVKLIGTHGPRSRPANVWAVAWRDPKGGITAQQMDLYRARMNQYARMPLGWLRRLRYQVGRIISGRRPFAPHLDRERWSMELHEKGDGHLLHNAA